MTAVNRRFLVMSVTAAVMAGPLLVLAGNADARKGSTGRYGQSKKVRDHRTKPMVRDHRAPRKVRDHRDGRRKCPWANC